MKLTAQQWCDLESDADEILRCARGLMGTIEDLNADAAEDELNELAHYLTCARESFKPDGSSYE